MVRVRAAGFLGLALLAVGCSADRIERGVFHSSKGYRVSLPPPSWGIVRGGKVDLELRRATPRGGMLADATCEGRTPRRPLGVLARHLTFGLTDRETVEDGAVFLGGLPGVRTVVRGSLDGTEVSVEMVVLKGGQCVYDFLYVAPVDDFPSGRPDFRALVESFSGGAR